MPLHPEPTRKYRGHLITGPHICPEFTLFPDTDLEEFWGYSIRGWHINHYHNTRYFGHLTNTDTFENAVRLINGRINSDPAAGYDRAPKAGDEDLCTDPDLDIN